VTALLSAQRKAAWSDVARRIAHEIKNPLTPIQLSAERLRRKYLKEIESDPEVFAMCTDTIVRHVEDIGRMVDEFSSFARMPEPVMQANNLTEICKRELALQRSAYPNIDFEQKFDDAPFEIICDRRQISQALTNLLQNSIDSFSGDDGPVQERISVDFRKDGDIVAIEVVDNGKGLPEEERDRLTEPYITTREKGTGLGLAIVRKIMEDHGGEVLLEDAESSGESSGKASGESGGAKVSLVLSARITGKVMDEDEGADKAVSPATEIVGHGV
jgi:two-component system nitrogen regulation sensor histidine kinase NtrY